ncbi:MAG: response regulator [Lachnospiraceae bacterium]|nr:response regulator [Lachnospiraceae bacterium]
MDKYKRIGLILTGICAVMVFIIIGYMGFVGKLDRQEKRTVVGCQQIVDYRQESISEAEKYFIWKIPELTPGGEYVGFYSSHVNVEVYLGEELVYSLYPDEENAFGHTTATSWNVIPLYPEDSGKELRIKFESVYDSFTRRSVEIFRGSQLGIFLQALKNSAWLIIISIIAIVIGIILVFITLVNIRNVAMDKNLLYLGIFSIIAGVWKISDTNFSPLMFSGNTLVLSYVTIGMLQLIMVPYNMYIASQFPKGRHKVLYGLSIYVSVVGIILCSFQLLNIYDFRQTLYWSHAVMSVDIMGAILVLFYEAFHDTLNQRLKITVVGTICAAIATLGDLGIFYFTGSSQWAFLGLSCFEVYVIVMAVLSFREALQATKIALDKAEAANRTKTIFLSNMSHDIRTPMNAIIGYNNIAQKHVNDVDRVTDCLQKIDSASAHLLNLINDVLDMGRIESGKMSFRLETYNLKDMFQSILDAFANQMAEKKIQFTTDLSSVRNWSIKCDLLKINQVVYNLLSNAVKYTNPGGRVDMLVEQMDGPDPARAYYCFKVKDTGIGMSKEFCQHAFQMFERERNYTESNIQGTGLGLAISKAIVEMAGGTISVESELGVGTEFTIFVNFEICKEQDNTPIFAEELEVAEYVGKQILLVEDNELNREIALEIMREAGLQVEIAVDGLEAVEMVTASEPGHYDLIFVDIQMPRMDGYEATRQIRALSDKKLASIPIVAMTANAFEEDRQKAFEAGMDEHISKPVDIKAIRKAIEKLL